MQNTFIKSEIVAGHIVAIWKSEDLSNWDIFSYGYYAIDINGNILINWGGFSSSSVDALLANARIEIPLEVEYRARREKERDREAIQNAIKEFESAERLIAQD